MGGRNLEHTSPRTRAARATRLTACLAVLLTLTFGTSAAALGDLDNKGTDFLMAFMVNASTPVVELHLTADATTDVTVTYPADAVAPTFSETRTVNPGSIEIVTLPVAAAQNWVANAIASNLVRATAPLEFVAYMVNRSGATSDAGLALPVDVLNNDYIVIDYDALGGYAPEFVVFANSDATTVTITPAATLSGGRTAGVPFDVTLNKGEGYHGRGPLGGTISGTTISADKPIGMTNGDICTNVPVGFGACDHIFEVAQPVQTWGSTIPVANLPLRTAGSIYRVAASEDATTVNLDGAFLATLDRGEYVEVPGDAGALAGGHLFTASAPIFVAQFMTGVQFEDNNNGEPLATGDPAMGNMVPTEQYLTDYTFSTVGGAQFSQNWLTVIADDRDLDTITLDAAPIGAENFTSIPGSGFSWAHVQLSDGTHTTSSANGHGITVEGYNNADSYIYPGGALIFPINVADENPPLCAGDFVDGVFAGTATDNRPTEDGNNNNELDPGEDLNDNGIIDVDTGIFDVSLGEGAVNVQLTVNFTPGDPIVNFSVAPIEGNQGSGNVIARDGAANECSIPIVLGPPDEDPPECDLFFDFVEGEFVGSASDAETGIATIELSLDTINLSLDADFSAGDSPVGFTVLVDNPSAPAMGTVVVTDGGGNECRSTIDLPFVHPANESDGWGEDIAVQGIGENLYAYVAAGEAGAHVWDVTDPANPIFLSTEVPNAGSCQPVGGGYPAFYADAVTILQLSSLPFESPVFTSDVAFFAAGACGLVVADIDDPFDVEQAAFFDTPSWAEAVDVHVDNIGETVTVYVASFWGGLRIFGQTDPLGDPTAYGEIGSWGVNDLAIGPAIDLGVERRDGMVLAHVLTDVGLRTVDVSDPLNPVEIGSFEFDPALNESGEGMTIVGNRAYIAVWRGGLLVLDISDPTNPVELETIPTDLAIYSVTTNSPGTRLYAAEGMFGVRTFSINFSQNTLIEQIPSPVDVADGGWAWSLAERNRVLYVAYGHLTDPLSGGFQIFEYADDLACGLGFELAFLLPPILWLRNRRRRRA